MTAGFRCAWVAIGSLVAGVHAAEAPPPDDRIAAHREFRSLLESGRFEEALTAATRVVEMTRSQFGEEALELVNPVTNLATAYYRQGRFEPAMDNYRIALKLLENETDTADPRLVRPLHGLGVSLQGLERYEESVVPLKRALDIIRNREGLFAISQLPLLHPLSAAYTATHRLEEAGSTQQYALTVAETAYGKSDVRLLGPLDEFGRWNELTGRFAYARLLHARAIQIADNRTQEGKVLAIDGLRGVARSYRLAYLFGESEESTATALNASMADSQLQRAIVGPPAEGERALRTALELLRTSAPGDVRTYGEVLVDLGDWFLTGGSDTRALASYREAWKNLSEAGATQRLETPYALTYRPPSIAVSRGIEDADRYEERNIDLSVSVDARGEVREASVVAPVASQESAERAVANALRRARFRPAFAAGEPVAKTDTPFRERVYVRRPDPEGNDK